MSEGDFFGNIDVLVHLYMNTHTVVYFDSITHTPFCYHCGLILILIGVNVVSSQGEIITVIFSTYIQNVSVVLRQSLNNTNLSFKGEGLDPCSVLQGCKKILIQYCDIIFRDTVSIIN